MLFGMVKWFYCSHSFRGSCKASVMGFGLGNTISFRIDVVARREVEESNGDVKEPDTRRL